MCIIEHFGNADAVPQPPKRCLSRKAGIVRCCLKYNCLKQAAGEPKPRHSPAACFTLVDAKFRAKLSMPYALMKELSRFTAYRSPVRMYAAICQKRTPCSRSPSGNPPHFADRRDESVIVGYCTSAEVPFECSKGTPGGRSPLKKGVAA